MIMILNQRIEYVILFGIQFAIRLHIHILGHSKFVSFPRLGRNQTKEGAEFTIDKCPFGGEFGGHKINFSMKVFSAIISTLEVTVRIIFEFPYI